MDESRTLRRSLLFDARTRVHEYGGGGFTVDGGTVYFSNFPDQRIYYLAPGGEPTPLTPEAGRRYADMVIDQDHRHLIAVREDHAGHEPVNEIVGVDLESGEERVIVSGNAFYSSPRPSPDGRRLVWLTWNHPNMPWDGTQLMGCDLGADGLPENVEQIAGGQDESIFQPEWSPEGTLHFVSDRTGWWNPYRLCEGRVEPLCQREAEFGLPQRSPIHSTGQLSCPVIFFQGLEDEVVPKEQAEKMFAALREKGLPVSYVPFEGEQHGFRQADNIKRALDGELYFYSRVFGFRLADPVEPIPIENL
jgi:dipeptidyl aminopeptidase/acylaminoacyl peptidase